MMQLYTLLIPLTVALSSAKGFSTCGKSDELRSATVDLGVGSSAGLGNCTAVPWLVRLFGVQGGLECLGSIISPRHILTSAHCLRNGFRFMIRIGDYDDKYWDQTQYDVLAEKVTFHPSYGADIAIVTLGFLGVPISLKDKPCTRPVCLDPEYDFDGQSCTLAGWGFDTRKHEDLPLPLVAQLRTSRGSNCVVSNEEVVCTDVGVKPGARPISTPNCPLAKGAPLVCWNNKTQSYVQVGITSIGNTCADPWYFGTSTNVAHFYPWIKEVVTKEGGFS